MQDEAKVNLIGQVQNLLNRTNFAAVNNIMPASPDFTLPGGGNLLNGPYNVRGLRRDRSRSVLIPVSI
jgi:hypothetical protein